MTWLFYTLLPGGLERMDHAVDDLLRPAAQAIRATPGCDRWFYIRYYDDRGAHLRLRAHTARRDDADGLQRRLDALLCERLPAVAREAPQPRRPLLPTPPAHVMSSATGVGFEQSIYEPEWEKYGDAPGVAVAEELFEASSDIALELSDAGMGSGARAALSLALMGAVTDAGVQPQRRAGFWHDYAAYWTTGAGAQPTSPAARFLGRAAERVAPLLAPASAALAADAASQGSIASYASAATSMLAAARERAVARSAEHLCFHHVHMTNNRLGMTLVEEALLAVVLARRQPEETS